MTKGRKLIFLSPTRPVVRHGSSSTTRPSSTCPGRAALRYSTVIQFLSFILPLFPALKEVGAKVPQIPLKKGGSEGKNRAHSGNR